MPRLLCQKYIALSVSFELTTATHFKDRNYNHIKGATMSSVISRIAALMSCACLLLVLASCASLLQTGKIRNDVGIVIDKASLQGNYLAEKSAREVGLLIEDINSDIQANERTIFDFTNETLDRIQSQIDNYLQALGQAQDELL
jgi:uncharacterized protein HemX